ncbi:MAG: MFS transporter [Mogibacterium sp.]|nr:MFS transporter [Mogibacterium sp.]
MNETTNTTITTITAKQAKRNMFFFPVGTLGRDMIYNMFTNYILLYVLFTHNLTAAQLMAITGIMIGARIFDALNDPLMGNIIERTRTRWGKYKPWLVIGILSTSVVVYLAFNVKLEGWAFIWFFGIIYFAYSISYTMHDISYWGMIPSLTQDGGTRDKLTAMTNLCAGIGGAVAGLMIPMLTTGSGTIGGNAQTAYGVVALIFCVLAPLFLSFTIFGVREDRSYMDVTPPPVSFKKIVSTIVKNDQLSWMCLIFLMHQIGADLIIGGIGSTYIYFTYGYKGGLYSLFSTIGLSASGILLIAYPWLSSKWKRKTLLKGFGIVLTVGFALMLAAGLFMPATMLSFWITTAGYMLAQLGMNCYYVIMMLSIINTVEYNEYKNGTRDEAIVASIRPFFTKMGSALAVLLTTVSYLIFGATNYTNQISALEQAANMGSITEAEKLTQIEAVINSVTSTQSHGLLLVMCLIPLVMMLAAYLLYKKYYILDEDEFKRIVEELAERNNNYYVE